jgi:hypothetical protein
MCIESLKCGSEEGWRRSLELIMLRDEEIRHRVKGRGIFYM